MGVPGTIFANVDGLGPHGSSCAVLAEMGNSSFLAIGLMIAGALVLRQAFRSRKDQDDAVLREPGRVAPLSPLPVRAQWLEGAERDGEELRAVLVEVKQLRSVLADEADRHAERLEALIARAEEKIRRLETLSASDAAARADGGPVVDPLNRRIYELADQGLPPVEIARSLSQQTGKVELVLALRPR